jgi:alcohol dehydrogenase class IV
MNYQGKTSFEFATAGRVIFGRGQIKNAGSIVKEYGTSVFLVTGRNRERILPLLGILEGQGVRYEIYSFNGEPTIETVSQGLELARAMEGQAVLAFGGGSVIDAGKAIAVMLTNPGEVLDYLEVVGRGEKLASPSMPFVAIPTTAGTGSEVTRNAVLASPDHRVKVSLRSPYMLPAVALIDPDLTEGIPPQIAATTGLDALTQVLEPFVSLRANPMTDGFCEQGIRRAARSLLRMCENSSDAGAREDMAFASAMGGMALANAGLGVVHGFAGPIGGAFPAPHGAVCAALLPHAFRVNVQALRAREPGAPALNRYAWLSGWLEPGSAENADRTVEWLTNVLRQLKIAPLRTYGIQPEHFSDLVLKSRTASSMKTNPITLTDSELEDILRAAW